MDISISRPSEFKLVTNWLGTSPQAGQVDIFGVSGYGGIGKSYLVSQVLNGLRPESKGFLSIKVDGSDASILGNFMALYDRKFAPRVIPYGNASYDYFKHSRNLVKDHEKLAKSVTDAIRKSDIPDDLKKAVEWIFKGGSMLNKSIPKTKEHLDFEALRDAGLDKGIDEAIDFLSSLKPLASTSWIPGGIKDITGITYKEKLKTSLYQLSANEWVSDVAAILTGYQRKKMWHYTHLPIDRLKRLLLIIDDFEILGKTIIEFVTTELIPALELTTFHSTIIILGRDDLSDAHISFQHHLSPLVKGKIRLEQFSKKVTEQMFREAGHSPADVPTLLKESQGYPFLVTLLCESKGGSVSFYQQFYERTTRWMAPLEKSWVLPLCYLDQVSASSIEEMMPGVSPDAVMEWFKHEASLRDPNAENYVISPYIRRTLLEYHRKELGSKKHKEMVAKGKEASKLA